jgi:hypothetical protein
MKKITSTLILLFCISFSLLAQKVKPSVFSKPNTSFLKTLQQNAKEIDFKNTKDLTINEIQFFKILQSASNASSWDKTAYKTFIKKISPVIKNMGIIADSDDGGEVFSDPDDGGEIYASTALVAKAIFTGCNLYPEKCRVCIGCRPTVKKITIQ